MSRHKDVDLFYVATIIEYTARTSGNEVSHIADAIGISGMSKVYEFADVSHCLPFAQVADELIQQYGIEIGNKEADLPHVPVTVIGAAYANYVMEHQSNEREYIVDLVELLRSPEKMDEIKVIVAARNVLEQYRPAFKKLAE